ncbi:sigma-70 family RNA polymerase sigma factor [Caulobacter sp. NIBR1757]|uniref:sigma-70 family RNA polymerase sigma factor n=1 Tax=Caulobacter sp. NIBR1757 TaxID=3016000 RepID=UPI0022F05601|nr:sigma-70 family RNA polymerase sigma factor [Caulobacter sp. NIBR1757]WGM38227.1 ECF RNA polymerase sigma factor SigJ [Caulobacter sp. NIBR1757]
MSDTAAFEAQRPRLKRLAYRMLGSVSEAEDVVQDTWLRWDRAGDAALDAGAWLAQTTTRLCLDRLKSARARRETYVGPWLPEPLIEEEPVDPLERAEDVSVAFLLALERLSPLERAVFLLHDVFDQDYGQVAKALGRDEAACRQLASRARGHLKEARPRYSVPQDEALRLAAAFMTASASQDFAALERLLARDAVLISDGGGKRKAALRPLVGREDVIALLKGLAWRGPWAGDIKDMRPARINGLPGVILRAEDGVTTMAFEPDGEGRIAAIYIMRNPEKLGHLSPG